MEKQEVIAGKPGKVLDVPELTVIKGNIDTPSINISIPVHEELHRFFPFKISAHPVIHISEDNSLKIIAKRTGDIIVSLLVIVLVLSWLIPIITLLIKLDSRGPVFFFQKRNKKGGSVFTCIKFRSMIVNNEANTRQAGRYDNRITRVGKFLRNHYLDELPQFFNVLAGDMSVVGPRPHMINDNRLYDELIDHYSVRHKVKPGITGLAQVLGYVGNTDDIQDMKDRVYLDVFYVRHYSFLMDIRIMARTFLKVFGF